MYMSSLHLGPLMLKPALKLGFNSLGFMIAGKCDIGGELNEIGCRGSSKPDVSVRSESSILELCSETSKPWNSTEFIGGLPGFGSARL